MASFDKQSQSSGDKITGGADIEKIASPHGEEGVRHTVIQIEDLDDGVPRNKGIFAKLWKVAHKFDAVGAEARGIERVRPEDKPMVRNVLLFWAFCTGEKRSA
jgi:hypothetical protein